MQIKRTFDNYELYYDSNKQGDIIIRDFSTGQSMVIPYKNLYDIFKFDLRNEINFDNSENITLIQLLSLSIIKNDSIIEVYSGSTAIDNLVFEDTVKDFKDCYTPNDTEDKFYKIGNSYINSIWNDFKSNNTIILLE